MAPRFLVGIDLGTTNSALAFIDLSAATRQISDFPLPQLVAPGTLAPRPTLHSLHQHVGEHELPAQATRLPWTPKTTPDPDFVVGELARVQAQAIPGRAITSAKSWLCHAGVDRLAPILPWGAQEDFPRLSPVEASARYLRHMTAAFCHDKGCQLADCEVVLTLPASFDEVARELTVEAARRAGIEATQLTLLEEPQAAFYHWLSEHSRLGEEVAAGEQIFVCDIGGGTTDFSLISVQKNASKQGHLRLSFARTAVGEHILLGGDNMDLALARRVEQRLLGQGTRLSATQLVSLVQSCRIAKEKLLSDEGRSAWSVHVAGRGSRLIGGGISTELLRSEVEPLLLDGFFPLVSADAEPARARGGLTEFGLPYAADPAVTRHIAAFLRQHRARPTALLYNGGVLCAEGIRTRIVDALERLLGHRPRLLGNSAPDLAVARGAAYYALARRGEGLRISGGAARAYYIEIEGTAGAPSQLLCLTPRGLEEGIELALGGAPLALLTNRPVRFRLFASASRQGDAPGQLLPMSLEELHELPPLYTVLRHPRTSQERPLQVTLLARLSELGTLDLWAQSTEVSDEGNPNPLRWRLQFDLRASEAGTAAQHRTSEPAPQATEARDNGTLSADLLTLSGSQAGLLAAACDVLQQTFSGTASPTALTRALQEILGPREGWTPPVLRGLWEALKTHRDARSRSAAHEARWLNLAGFCLRPGFGYPLDDWRVKELWRVFNIGLLSERDDPCRLEWWILWRRIAGGLSRTQQDELWKRAAPLVLPSLRKLDKKPPSPQEAAEIWRALAACERLESKKRADLGEHVVSLVERKRSEWTLWALSRLGARVPLYGPTDTVISPLIVDKWVQRLLAIEPNPASDKPGAPSERFLLAQAVSELSRLSGDRVRDLNEAKRKPVLAWMEQQQAALGPAGEPLLRALIEILPREQREQQFAFGDTLPPGLRLLSAPEQKIAEP